MARVSIIFFMLVIVVCAFAAPEGLKCRDENEEYSKCGPQCEQQCNNSRTPKCPPKLHDQKCYNKCICKGGFIRLDGRCIEEESHFCGGKYIPAFSRLYS
ncbi:chymotrypsin inhibitor Ani s 6-like [Contarinia nasturtii]|uniref:chymotrypsin inhibitor Ani s 6-like n=1 Tax=Contarinia nasturtii TaxID=265458 RepID=UPI0012D3E3B7|nr:chymotrypsin inhibitor Ani s 6-like [Contarinia nasturtii]